MATPEGITPLTVSAQIGCESQVRPRHLYRDVPVRRRLGLFGREVPADAELDAKFAARACPVDAIEIYDDDGEQLV